MGERLSEARPFKRQVFLALEDPRHAGTAGRIFGGLLFVLIAVNAVLVFGEMDPSVPYVIRFSLAAISTVSTLLFGLEYLLRVWVADLLYPDLSPVRARVRYVISLLGIIDLLAFLPGMLAWFLPLSSITKSAAHVARLVRLFKLSRYMRGLHTIARVFGKRRSEITAAFMVLALLTVTASVLMYEAEHPVQPEQFDSVFTGMYWAMTTITSTGYGDLVPITPLGRFVGFLVMVLSIAVVAIPAGIFSAGFVAEFRAQDARSRLLGTRGRGGDAVSEADVEQLEEAERREEDAEADVRALEDEQAREAGGEPAGGQASPGTEAAGAPRPGNQGR